MKTVKETKGISCGVPWKKSNYKIVGISTPKKGIEE